VNKIWNAPPAKCGLIRFTGGSWPAAQSCAVSPLSPLPPQGHIALGKWGLFFQWGYPLEGVEGEIPALRWYRSLLRIPSITNNMKARYEITHVPNLGVDWVKVQIDHGDGIAVEDNQFGVREFPSLLQAEEYCREGYAQRAAVWHSGRQWEDGTLTLTGEWVMIE